MQRFRNGRADRVPIRVRLTVAHARQKGALVAAQNAAVDSTADSVRDREIAVEQTHLDRVYTRLEEKIHEAEFLMNDAAKRGQVGTPVPSPSATRRSSGRVST